MKKRVDWIDIIKYICIIFVMFRHTEFNNDFAESFFYNFFLFGFFFASGYTYTNRNSFYPFIVKKAKALLVPWFIFGIVNLLLAHVISFNTHMSLARELFYFFLQVRGLYDGMWFLSALFVTYIPFYFLIKKYETTDKSEKDRLIVLVVCLMLSIFSRAYLTVMDSSFFPWNMAELPWHLEYVFVAMFWMVFGYFFRYNYEAIFDNDISNLAKVLILFAYSILVWLVKPQIIQFAAGQTGLIYTYYYIAEGLAVFSLIFVSKLIKPNKYMLYIGQNTLICFGIHGKILSIYEKSLNLIAGDLSFIKQSIILSTTCGIVSSLFISILMIIPIYIINRYFPFILGIPRKKGAV